MAEETKEEKIDSLWKKCVTTITYTGVTDPKELPEGITAFEWTFKGTPMKPVKRKKLTLRGLELDLEVISGNIGIVRENYQAAYSAAQRAIDEMSERIAGLEERADSIGKVITAIAVQPKPCWWCRLMGRR